MICRRRRPPKRTTLSFPQLAATVGKEDVSYSLGVQPRQVVKANEVARAMRCGEPFHRSGDFVATRATKTRYMRELNKRLADRGKDRLVNYDGGYRDVT